MGNKTYLDIITKIARENLSEGEDAGCGMYNFSFVAPHINGVEKYDDDVILQVFPNKEDNSYGVIYILAFYRDNKGAYTHDDINFFHLNEDEKQRIFRAFVEEYNSERLTYEVCPHCGEEVLIENELKVQVCPSCGKHIVTCSMCVACGDGVEGVCKNCPLAYLAEKMNDESAENGIYERLMEETYTEKTLGYGDGRKVILIDEDEKVRLRTKDGKHNNAIHIITDICFLRKNEGDEQKVCVTYVDENDIICSEIMDYHNLEVSTLINVDKALPKKEFEFGFRGTAKVTINQVEVKGRTRAEALRKAKEMVEDALTMYGTTDTQIDDLELDVNLE